MDPSETNINLYLERRQRKSMPSSNETSPFFEPSRSRGKPENRERTMIEDDTSTTMSSPRPRGKQTVLQFSNGHLSTKLPLTNPTPRSDAARMSLADIAKETVQLLPGLLATRPDIGTEGELYQLKDLGPIRSHLSPNLPPTTIRVIDADTIDAALTLQSQSQSTQPVCVLNMANAAHAGGGFKHGALAQEEALCYRTSLIFTLKLRYYPIPEEGAIFSPKVLVIRQSMSNGHDLLDFRTPAQLPVISIVSCAAVCQPRLTKDARGRSTYASRRDKELMIKKMRVILRICVKNGCRKIVLGAFGCGAFANPAGDVAEMWREVLGEREFGGCWEEVVFAVLDGKRDDNYTTFKMVLGGMMV